MCSSGDNLRCTGSGRARMHGSKSCCDPDTWRRNMRCVPSSSSCLVSFAAPSLLRYKRRLILCGLAPQVLGSRRETRRASGWLGWVRVPAGRRRSGRSVDAGMHVSGSPIVQNLGLENGQHRAEPMAICQRSCAPQSTARFSIHAWPIPRTPTPGSCCAADEMSDHSTGRTGDTH